jgi:hypothetical protein
MRESAEIADDARQRGRHDVLIQCCQGQRQHQPTEDDPKLLPGRRPAFRFESVPVVHVFLPRCLYLRLHRRSRLEQPNALFDRRPF